MNRHGDPPSAAQIFFAIPPESNTVQQGGETHGLRQSMTTLPTNVNVTAPITPAFERVKLLLFRPFNLNRWFTIGFCAWLAGLGRAGYSFNFNTGPTRRAGGIGSGVNFREVFEGVRDYVMAHLVWILPLAVALVVVLLAMGIVMTWLRSRGSFMFLHCVALDKAEVAIPWQKFAREGDSLFRFRLVMELVWLLWALPIVALMLLVIVRMAHQGQIDAPSVVTLLPLGLTFFALAILFLVIGKLTSDFVVPIVFLRGGTCRAAWMEFLGLLSIHVPDFVVYLLFQIVIALATSAVVIVAVIATCCIAGCLMIIPYIGTVLLLPVTTFKRSYSLHYLAQYGPAYDVFSSFSVR